MSRTKTTQMPLSFFSPMWVEGIVWTRLKLCSRLLLSSSFFWQVVLGDNLSMCHNENLTFGWQIAWQVFTKLWCHFNSQLMAFQDLLCPVTAFCFQPPSPNTLVGIVVSKLKDLYKKWFWEMQIFKLWKIAIYLKTTFLVLLSWH